MIPFSEELSKGVYMTKELKAEVFTDMRSLCDFVNTRQITQENIQSITEVSVDGMAYATLCYWETTE